jgi:hypothetical protein
VTAHDLKHHRGGGIDPFQHNRLVARRKKYRRIARQIRTSSNGTSRAFRNLAAAADRAAESLRDMSRSIGTVRAPDSRRRTS